MGQQTQLLSVSDPEGTPQVNRVTAEEFFKNIKYVTLKVTNGCNLQCTYCNVEADRPSTPRMSLDVFRRIVDVYVPNSRVPFVGLEFHGGEPLLLPDEWYREAVGYAAEIGQRHGKTVRHPLQTNGTMLTEQRLDALLEMGIQIGFSLDGPPHINDRYRASGNAVQRAIERMRSRDLGFGVILVLSRANCNDMHEVMEYFRDIGVRDYRVNFLQPQGRGVNHDLLTGEEMFCGMRSIFEHMLSTDCSVIEADVQLAVNRFCTGRSSTPPLSCWEHECQAGRNYVAIDYRGYVYACGTDMSNHQLGNIFTGFEPAGVRSTLGSLHRKDPWYVRCFGCNARQICNQSCATSNYNDPTFREAECLYTRLLYSYFTDRSEDVWRLHHALRSRRPQFNTM